MANNDIVHPRLLAANMLQSGFQNAMGLMAQMKQLEAQKQELALRREEQKLDRAIKLFQDKKLPTSLRSKIYNSTIRPSYAKLAGEEIPELSDSDFERDDFKTILAGANDIDGMNLDPLSKKALKQKLFAPWLASVGREREAVELLFTPEEKAAEQGLIRPPRQPGAPRAPGPDRVRDRNLEQVAAVLRGGEDMDPVTGLTVPILTRQDAINAAARRKIDWTREPEIQTLLKSYPEQQTKQAAKGGPSVFKRAGDAVVGMFKKRVFKTPEEALSANLPPGTEVLIDAGPGKPPRRAVIE